MLHTDNELINQIIRTAQDPDPLRAAQYRPFAYLTANASLIGETAIIRRPLTMPPLRSLPRTLLAWVRGFALFQRPAPAPCCLAAV